MYKENDEHKPIMVKQYAMDFKSQLDLMFTISYKKEQIQQSMIDNEPSRVI